MPPEELRAFLSVQKDMQAEVTLHVVIRVFAAQGILFGYLQPRLIIRIFAAQVAKVISQTIKFVSYLKKK